MPIDKTKNQRKGFCFITFDNEQIVHELLKKPKQTINGKEVSFHICFALKFETTLLAAVTKITSFYLFLKG